MGLRDALRIEGPQKVLSAVCELFCEGWLCSEKEKMDKNALFRELKKLLENRQEALARMEFDVWWDKCRTIAIMLFGKKYQELWLECKTATREKLEWKKMHEDDVKRIRELEDKIRQLETKTKQQEAGVAWENIIYPEK